MKILDTTFKTSSVRKTYVKPEVECKMFVPLEDLTSSWKWHTGKDEDRWAINGWGFNQLGDASGVIGTYSPEGWVLPEE